MPEDAFLGAPLPGALALPFWRASIGSRGDQATLEWGIAKYPPPPASEAAIAEFVSLPKPASPREATTLLKGRKPPPGLAVFTLRTMPEARPLLGGPPWYGGVLDDFVKLHKLPDVAIVAFASHWARK